MRPLNTIIFDLDGTLINSAPDIRHALNRLLTEQGRANFTLPEVEAMMGDGMLPLLERAFANTGGIEGSSYQYFQTFITYYRNLKPDPEQIYPYAREFITQCSASKITMGICTNKPELATRHLLTELGLAQFFGFMAGGDTFQTHKPHPDHVLGVMDALNASAETTIMIGDSSQDVHAAHGAKIPCIAVSQGYGQDLSTIGADVVIKNFHAMPEAIKKLGFDFPFSF